MKNKFTSKEISKLMGIKARRVRSYTDMGLVSPEIYFPKGRGKSRIYSKNNIYQLAICKELFSFGLTSKIVKKIMESDKNNFKHKYGAIKISIDIKKIIESYNKSLNLTSLVVE